MALTIFAGRSPFFMAESVLVLILIVGVVLLNREHID